jgi:hypothetical protein
MQALHASSGQAARHTPGLQPSLPELRSAPAAQRLGAASAAQGAMGCDSAQAGRARKSGYFRVSQGRSALMAYVIGSRFSRLLPEKDRALRTDEMLAALVACDAGYTSPASIDAAVGVPRMSSASGLAVAKRMGLVAPIAADVPLYKPTPLGETVLRFLDAEVA